MTGSERAGTILLGALGFVLGAIALWQPVGSVADSPRRLLVLDVPAWVRFLVLSAALAEFLAIVLIVIPNRLRRRSGGTPRKRLSAQRLSPIALLLFAVAVAIVAHQLQSLKDGPLGWLFGPGSGGEWFGDGSADPPSDMASVPLLDLGVSVTLSIVAAVVMAGSVLAVLLVKPWVTLAEWFREARERGGESPTRRCVRRSPRRAVSWWFWRSCEPPSGERVASSRWRPCPASRTDAANSSHSETNRRRDHQRAGVPIVFRGRRTTNSSSHAGTVAMISKT
jgi:hypothetical protein